MFAPFATYTRTYNPSDCPSANTCFFFFCIAKSDVRLRERLCSPLVALTPPSVFLSLSDQARAREGSKNSICGLTGVSSREDAGPSLYIDWNAWKKDELLHGQKRQRAWGWPKLMLHSGFWTTTNTHNTDWSIMTCMYATLFIEYSFEHTARLSKLSHTVVGKNHDGKS